MACDFVLNPSIMHLRGVDVCTCELRVADVMHNHKCILSTAVLTLSNCETQVQTHRAHTSAYVSIRQHTSAYALSETVKLADRKSVV